MAPTRRNDFVSMMSRCCVLAWHSLNELDAPTARRRMLAATSGEPCTRGQGRPARAEQSADGVRRQCPRNPRRLHSPRPRTPTRMLRSMRPDGPRAPPCRRSHHRSRNTRTSRRGRRRPWTQLLRPFVGGECEGGRPREGYAREHSQQRHEQPSDARAWRRGTTGAGLQVQVGHTSRVLPNREPQRWWWVRHRLAGVIRST